MLKAATAPLPPLPRGCIIETGPFNVIGVNFCSPKCIPAASHTKAYVALLSRAVTRAIHLELLFSTSTTNFLPAFRRFVSRRGIPSIAYAGNTRTFHYCDERFRMLCCSEVQDHSKGLRIHRKFSLENAPWWGGWWEGIIRTIKDTLKKTLGRTSLRFEELTTTLFNVEAAVNCRPLAHISTDPDEFQALTPSQLLTGKRAVSLPPKLTGSLPTSTAPDLRRRVLYRQRLIAQLWKRWKRISSPYTGSPKSCMKSIKNTRRRRRHCRRRRDTAFNVKTRQSNPAVFRQRRDN